MSDAAAPRAAAPPPGCPAAAERVFRLLLRAYPPAFRAAFGGEMTQLFRDQWRTRDAGLFDLWLRMAWDVIRSAPALRIKAWRARGGRKTPTSGGIMKSVSIAVLLLAAVSILSAIAEGVAGIRTGFGAAYLIAVVLAVSAGALLLVAGVTALRGTPLGRRTATRAAIASLVLFVLARVTFGWMSVFAQLVGIVVPLVILVALHWPRHHDASATRAV